MRRTLYSLTTAFTTIPATQFSRLVELQEDGSVTAVGLKVKYPDDNFTATFSYLPTQEPVVLGDKVANTNAKGYILGWPAQGNNILVPHAADTYCMVAAATGTTTLRVTEYD
jgi:hypothetical protein